MVTITHLLQGLLGKRVTGELKSMPDAKPPIISGSYIDDGGEERFGFAFDLPLAAYAGAALLAFPSSRANENIKAGKLEPILEENIREVLNVLAQTLNVAGERHLRLAKVVINNKPNVTPRARQLRLDLADYGSGRLIMTSPEGKEK